MSGFGWVGERVQRAEDLGTIEPECIADGSGGFCSTSDRAERQAKRSPPIIIVIIVGVASHQTRVGGVEELVASEGRDLAFGIDLNLDGFAKEADLVRSDTEAVAADVHALEIGDGEGVAVHSLDFGVVEKPVKIGVVTRLDIDRQDQWVPGAQGAIHGELDNDGQRRVGTDEIPAEANVPGGSLIAIDGDLVRGAGDCPELDQAGLGLFEIIGARHFLQTIQGRLLRVAGIEDIGGEECVEGTAFGGKGGNA